MENLIKVDQLNIMLIEIGVLFLLLVLAPITNSLRNKKKYLVSMSLSALLLISFDRYAYMYAENIEGFKITRICNFLSYIFLLILILSYNYYLKDIIFERKNEKSKILKGVNILIIIGIVLAILNEYVHMYYSFNENNMYVRGPLFFISYIPPLLSLVFQGIEIIRKISLKEKRGILLETVTILPIISSIAQTFTSGISFTNISAVVLVVILYIYALLDNNKALEESRLKEIKIIRKEEEKTKLMFEQLMLALINAFEYKNEYIRGHSKRVAEYSVMIAQKMGKDHDEISKIYFCALLHDIGKVGISEEIISRGNNLLNAEEFAEFKTHPKIGERILKEINLFPELTIGALYHHERYDGKGFPEKLSGKQIPEIARIIAVADYYDNLTSKKSYRWQYSQDEVKKLLEKGSGDEFDPVITDIMLEIIKEDKKFLLKQ